MTGAHVQKLLLSTATILAFMAVGVWAYPQTDDDVKNTKILSMPFEDTAPDFKGLKARINSRAENITRQMQDMGFPSIDLWNVNYGVVPVENAALCADSLSCYKAAGTISFTFLPAGREEEVTAKLANDGYNATVLQYYFGPCRGGADR